MPFKSKKQQAFMNMKAEKGEMHEGMVHEMNEKSKGMKLPAKAPKKPADKKPGSVSEMVKKRKAKYGV